MIKGKELTPIVLTVALVAAGVPLADKYVVPIIRPILRPTSASFTPQPESPRPQASRIPDATSIPVLTFTPPQLRNSQPTPNPEKTYPSILAATWGSFTDQNKELRNSKEGTVINIVLKEGEELDVQRSAGIQETTDNKVLVQVLFATKDHSQKVYMVIEKNSPSDNSADELEKQIPADHAEPLKAGTLISVEVKRFQLPTVSGSTPDTLSTFVIRVINSHPQPLFKRA